MLTLRVRGSSESKLQCLETATIKRSVACGNTSTDIKCNSDTLQVEPKLAKESIAFGISIKTTPDQSDGFEHVNQRLTTETSHARRQRPGKG